MIIITITTISCSRQRTLGKIPKHEPRCKMKTGSEASSWSRLLILIIKGHLFMIKCHVFQRAFG